MLHTGSYYFIFHANNKKQTTIKSSSKGWYETHYPHTSQFESKPSPYVLVSKQIIYRSETTVIYNVCSKLFYIYEYEVWIGLWTKDELLTHTAGMRSSFSALLKISKVNEAEFDYDAVTYRKVTEVSWISLLCNTDITIKHNKLYTCISKWVTIMRSIWQSQSSKQMLLTCKMCPYM